MKSEHPYTNIPDYRLWRKSVASVNPSEVDPVVSGAFKLDPSEKIVTAGSCFAQHIAKRLARSGFNYFVTETVHPFIKDVASEDYSYGMFSARYGNIYTSRQLLQLLQRAYGLFVPHEPVWALPSGGFADPFRPNIQPGGFATLDEYRADQSQHLAAVRRAVEEMDVFIFTLGLTEAWLSRHDGSVFPVCPGVAAGDFDSDNYVFANFTIDEVCEDMRGAIKLILEKKPDVKILLTVSPVPLVATAEDQSVIVSTAYSKAVLRVAAEKMAQEWPAVTYFPSYEIITSNFNRGRYFGPDLRSVTEEGVDHVMRLFMQHFTEGETIPRAEAPGPGDADNNAAMQAIAQAMCDEELLDAGSKLASTSSTEGAS